MGTTIPKRRDETNKTVYSKEREGAEWKDSVGKEDTGMGRETGKGNCQNSCRVYKCEDVLGSGRNLNGIGTGNRSGRTTRRIGAEVGGPRARVTCGMMLGHTGRRSGFPGQEELLFAYTQSTPTSPPFLPVSMLHTHLYRVCQF